MAQRNNPSDPLVVGIGASAGGLEAVSDLVSHLPTDTGMAFVLVQHLAADQESQLDELLSLRTDIPVVRAEDGMAVEANHVYVIPPAVELTLASGRLQLQTQAPSQRHGKVIDAFFKSLAAERKNSAIAIVLSGNNDDGSAGIRAIHEVGGITFAQDRDSAEFSTMPGAAVATRQVDFVLPPAQIAAELINISRHPYLQATFPSPEATAAEDTSTFRAEDLAAICKLLKSHTGVDFTQYKQTTFERRLRRRLAVHKLSQLQDYLQLLRHQPAEIQALYDDALITVTDFFRDPEAYTALEQQVFPYLLEQPDAQEAIRIWVAGCATGEEVYSIAICLLECLDGTSLSPIIQIFGTDVSDQAIEEARTGVYSESRLGNVSPERRRRFFSQVDSQYRINKAVRERCIFAKHDLSSDPPFSEIDLITCRNVLIYFRPALQQSVLSIFHYSLKPKGLLLLGNSGSVGETSDLFRPFDGKTKIYGREAVPPRINLDFVSKPYSQSGIYPERHSNFPNALNRSSIQQWADQIVLNRYAPVGVITNEQLDILQFRGDTSLFLRPPFGEPSFNLLKMIRPSLLNEVRAAIEQARQRQVAIKRQDLFLDESTSEKATLKVIPFHVDEERCFLILFNRKVSPFPDAGSIASAEVTPDNRDEEIEQLRHELTNARQELLDTQTFLQITVEEQEATHQQLVAAHEEILSSNEELRSTNEELQTAKEEIQSANEELKTTNEELQKRNIDSSRAQDDLLNLVNNVNIPIVMLSSDLRIRNFSPAARSVFNLIPTDSGRPITNIRSNVDIPDLAQLVRDVMETLQTTEREVQDQQGYWYLLRIRPYRTLENQIDGAVIALINIDSLRRTEQELRDSRAQLKRELLVTEQMRLLSLQLFASQDLEQVLHEVVAATMALLKADMANLQIYDPERQVLSILVQIGFEPSFLETFAEVCSSDQSSCGRALRTKRRVVIEDVQADSDFAPYQELAKTAGFRAVQSTPLINRKGEVLGMLSTHFRRPHRPTRRELQLLDIYTRQASEFIDLIQAENERQQLIEREQAARNANASKDEFLSVLSHELRTPLNSILGWTQLLISHRLDQPGTERAVATIHNSAQTQLQLIEDLLDASRMIQNRFQIERQPTDLNQLMQQTIEAIRPQTLQNQLQLETHFEDRSTPVMVDPFRIQQALSNLLANAIKFTPSGGTITVRLTYSTSHLQIQVSDTGIGIPPDFLPQIFDRFRQADASNTRRKSGLGLGLFLIKSIVAAHGGTIQAESAGPNQGTTFTLTLPLVAVNGEPLAAPAPSPATANLQGLRLLVVEDDEMNIEIYVLALEDHGATVIVAQTAAAALELLAQESIDVIISDIGLPNMNGYDFIQAVRSHPDPKVSQTPAIALSGYVSPQDVNRALEAGFQNHLPKPVDLDLLAASVHQLAQPDA